MIRRRDPIQDHAYEARLIKIRTIISMLGVFIVLCVLGGRLYFLQMVSYEHFTTRSENNRVKIVPVPPARGLIYDRNGTILAENLPAYRLELTREDIADVDATLQALKEYVEISESEERRFRKSMKQTRRFNGVVLKYNLSDAEVARLSAVRHRFPGVSINARLNRHYPRQASAVHTIGYVGRLDKRDMQRVDEANYRGTSHIGKSGVESYYEHLLHGDVGHRNVEVNAAGRRLKVLDEEPATAGKNIYLTLDIRLQEIAERALGDYSGSIVAVDPNNGDVLAIASTPSFDPNLFVNGISYKNYADLRDHPERPLFNRALTGTYPPGSTIKPVVGLAGLELGVQQFDQRIYCPGFYRLPGSSHRYRDWKRGGHGMVDLGDAIEGSCDILFYDLALRLGIDRLSDYLQQFGLGGRTGIDNGGESKGILPSRAWKHGARGKPWYPGETLITGIGQGYMTMTPVQMAYMTANLASRGKSMQPRLLYAVQDNADAELQLQQPVSHGTLPIVEDENWDYVLHGMKRVANSKRGTARKAFKNLPFVVGGKSGTAQVFTLKQDQRYKADELDRKLHDHALFVAYAPYDAPEIAVSVIVENGGSGSGVAAPMARKVLEAYLTDYAVIPPDDAQDKLGVTSGGE